MDIKERYEKALKILQQHGQSQLLTFWDELNGAQKENLLSQTEQIDFEQISRNVEKYVRNPQPTELPRQFTPAKAYPAKPTNAEQKQDYQKAKELGVELISAGKVAAFVVAGGQGTRLGFDGPKGNFPISPVKSKTLFQIFAENITAAEKKYRHSLRWYIMTSKLNYNQTVSILKQNNYYGLKPGNVFVFQQGTEPNFGANGKILLAAKDTIACSPDGHGGSLKALYNSGAIDALKSNGVEYISYFQVDNPLINIFDPLFIGLHALAKAQMSSKTLIKSFPKEKVGNFCIIDGKVTVIEYSDLPDEFAEKRNPNGSLTFSLGSIAIHIISVDFIERLNSKDFNPGSNSGSAFALPFHRAVKKIPYINSAGEKIEPEKPNGIKLETFVFDALPLAEKSIIFETLRGEEFAPVKNASGGDSPEVAKKMMSARAVQWLKEAGIAVPENADCIIEIAPSFALHKEDIVSKVEQINKISPGQKVYLA